MGLRQGQHVWVLHGKNDWAESVILELLEDDWVLVQQVGTERAEHAHLSRIFELRPGH